MKTDKFVPIKKSDAAKQIVYGEVYSPGVLDSQGEFMSAENIEKMAHDFMRKGLIKAIDTEHDQNENGSTVVESFVARPGDPDFAEASWVLGVHLPDDQWAAVQKGEINGFSMFGRSQREARQLEIEIPDDGIVKGLTASAGEKPHFHEYLVRFSPTGEFMGGEAVGSDHTHRITKGTATDVAQGHSHRFSYMEALK